jgi:2-oxoglutarate dehydrogenase E2 component (dihydrolipoamide succinyltransferase)
MKIEVKVPAMGESISEATVAALLKPEGSKVVAEEELIELETDKVNQILYAVDAGVLHWDVVAGDTVKIGQLLGTIDTEGAAAASGKPQKSEMTQGGLPPKEEKAPEAVNIAAPQALEAPEEPVHIPPPAEGAARLLKESFIASLAAHQPTEKAAGQPGVPKRAETRQKLSKIRRLISTRLVQVLQQTAMLTTFNEADMTQVMALREAYKEPFLKQHGVRLGFMSFFIKAVVSALKAFPDLQAYIDGDEMVTRHYYDISVAVGTEKGVITPVIRNCDQLSFAEIERSLEGYAKKAREGGLHPDELQGGGFTITNGGVYGSLLSTPILNPTQSAILGMHKIMKRPVVVQDQIAIRQMMYLALSYDHRVVDGKEAISFLVHIKNSLEDPSRLLIGV